MMPTENQERVSDFLSFNSQLLMILESFQCLWDTLIINSKLCLTFVARKSQIDLCPFFLHYAEEPIFCQHLCLIFVPKTCSNICKINLTNISIQHPFSLNYEKLLLFGQQLCLIFVPKTLSNIFFR